MRQLSKQLKAIRQSRYTRHQFSMISGLHFQMIQNIEGDFDSGFTVRLLLEYCKHLGVDISLTPKTIAVKKIKTKRLSTSA